MPEPTIRQDSKPTSTEEAIVSPEIAVIPAEEIKISSLDEQKRKVLMSLSKDLEELSKPFEPETPDKIEDEPPQERLPQEPRLTTKDLPIVSPPEIKVEPRVDIPLEDEASEKSTDTDEASSSPGGGFLRFLLLLVFLLLVIASAWQVCLFLQPGFMKKSPVKEFSLQSCQVFYCPPMREPRILKSELQAVGPDEWEIRLQLQNQDMREQELPQFILTLIQGQQTVLKAVFDSQDYKTQPEIQELRGGETITVNIPFRFAGGRPSQFKIKPIQTE